MRSDRETLFQGLIENAADFVDRSVREYHQDDYKYSVIHLWSGMLLFMKARLFQISPSLIYSKLDRFLKMDKSGMIYVDGFDIAGEKSTVGFDEIIARLKQLSIESSVVDMKNSLGAIRKLRNRIEHLGGPAKRTDYVAAITVAIPLLNALVEEEIGENPSQLFSSWNDLLEIDSFYQDRLTRNRLQVTLFEYDSMKQGNPTYTLPCSFCGEGEMVAINDTELFCSVCYHSTTFSVCEHCNCVITENDGGYLYQNIGICTDCFDGLVDGDN